MSAHIDSLVNWHKNITLYNDMGFAHYHHIPSPISFQTIKWAFIPRLRRAVHITRVRGAYEWWWSLWSNDMKTIIDRRKNVFYAAPLIPNSLTHSSLYLTHPLIHLSIYLIHPLIHSLIHLSISLKHSFTHPFISLSHSPTHSLTHSSLYLTHPLIHSLIHALTLFSACDGV